RNDPPGVLNPLADPAARVARIDHLLHLKPVEWPHRSARAFYARIDLGPKGGWIFRFGELALIGSFDAAFRRYAADISCRPRNACAGARSGCGEIVPRDTEAAAHDDGEYRNADLCECDHPLAALADRAGDLVLEANGKPWIVDQVQNRQVEQVAQIKMPSQFVATIGGQDRKSVV